MRARKPSGRGHHQNPDPELRRLTKKARALLEELDALSIPARSMLRACLMIDHASSIRPVERGLRLLADAAASGLGHSVHARRGRPRNTEAFLIAVMEVERYLTEHGGRLPAKTKEGPFEERVRRAMQFENERRAMWDLPRHTWRDDTSLHHVVAQAIDYVKEMKQQARKMGKKK